MPKICVCTAPEIPTVHRSEPDDVIAGEIADGGGDFTVVVCFPFEVTDEFDVDSDTIGSAAYTFILPGHPRKIIIDAKVVIIRTMMCQCSF
jgi:hypothetical protein